MGILEQRQKERNQLGPSVPVNSSGSSGNVLQAAQVKKNLGLSELPTTGEYYTPVPATTYTPKTTTTIPKRLTVEASINNAKYGLGNIDLTSRPVLLNPDGSISTVESISFYDDKEGKEILVPKIYESNGTALRLSDEGAIRRYYDTGEYLGKFDTAESATDYAKKLHESQDKMYAQIGEQKRAEAERTAKMAELNSAREELSQIQTKLSNSGRTRSIGERKELQARAKELKQTIETLEKETNSVTGLARVGTALTSAAQQYAAGMLGAAEGALSAEQAYRYAPSSGQMSDRYIDRGWEAPTRADDYKLNAQANAVKRAGDELRYAGAENMARAQEGLGTVGRLGITGLVAGTQMAADLGTGALIGGGSMLPMVVRSFGGGVQDARDKGYTVDQQLALGLANAATEYFTEKLFGGNLVYDKAGKTISTKDVGLVNKAINAAVSKVAGGDTARRLMGVLGSTTMETLNEGWEEVASDFLEPIWENLITGAVDDRTKEEEIRQYAESWIVGVMLGATGQAGQYVTTTARSVGPGKQIEGAGLEQNLIEVASRMDHDTEAYKTAQRMKSGAMSQSTANLGRLFLQYAEEGGDLSIFDAAVDNKGRIVFNAGTGGEAYERARNIANARKGGSTAESQIDPVTNAYLNVSTGKTADGKDTHMNLDTARAKADIVQRYIDGEKLTTMDVNKLDLTNAAFRAAFEQTTGVTLPSDFNNLRTAAERTEAVLAAQKNVQTTTPAQVAAEVNTVMPEMRESPVNRSTLREDVGREIEHDGLTVESFGELYRQQVNPAASDAEIVEQFTNFLNTLPDSEGLSEKATDAWRMVRRQNLDGVTVRLNGQDTDFDTFRSIAMQYPGADQVTMGELRDEFIKIAAAQGNQNARNILAGGTNNGGTLSDRGPGDRLSDERAGGEGAAVDRGSGSSSEAAEAGTEGRRGPVGGSPRVASQVRLVRELDRQPLQTTEVAAEDGKAPMRLVDSSENDRLDQLIPGLSDFRKAVNDAGAELQLLLDGIDTGAKKDDGSTVFAEGSSDADAKLVRAAVNSKLWSVLQLGWHELHHILYSTNPRYRTVTDNFKSALRDNEKLAEYVKKSYDSAKGPYTKLAGGEYSDRTSDYYLDEVCADLCGDMNRVGMPAEAFDLLRDTFMQVVEGVEDIQKSIAQAGLILDTGAGVTPLGSAEDVIEDSYRTEGEITTSDGKVVTQSNDEGYTRYSLRTYDETGRDILNTYLSEAVRKDDLTQDDANDIRDSLDLIYRICQEHRSEYAPFSAWSDAVVVTDENGNPVFSVVKQNDEYDMNLDFSLVCKKRRTLDAVLNELVRRGLADVTDLGSEGLVRVNNIIRSHGFETACAMCFVDSKRFRQAGNADKFAAKYNKFVESLIPEGSALRADHFNFGGNASLDETGAGIQTVPDSELDFTEIDRVLKENAPKSENGRGNIDYQLAKHIKENPQDRRLLQRGDLISSKGFESFIKNNRILFNIYASSKGPSGAKDTVGDVQYLNDVLTSKSFSPERAYPVGGVRIQSFSDYVPRLVFDYAQMIADLSAKKLPAHAYTKEELFVKQFGLTGLKINMSLIPAVVSDGVAAGLDANGDYVWADESFDFDTAVDIQNADGYGKNCGTIAVGVSDEHIRKLLADPGIRMVIPYHKSGLNPVVAEMNNISAFTNYTDSQNTRDANGTKLPKSKNTFNFNDRLHSLGAKGDPRAVAEEYVRWCEENNYIPKFDQFAYKQVDGVTAMRDGKKVVDENYYKLLEDFSVYDRGEYAPQEALRTVFPTGDSAFGSMNDLILRGLNEDAVLEGKRDAEVGKIVDEIAAMQAPGVRYSVADTDSQGRELTEAQQAYFSDTVVKDKRNRLKPQYHGTTQNFNAFRKGDVGYHFGTKTTARTRAGRGKNVNLMEVYLNITNPITFDVDLGSWDADYRLTQELFERGVLTQEEARQVLRTPNGYTRSSESANAELRKLLQSKGYDGISYPNAFESNGSTSYIVFDSNQAKRTDNLNPTESTDIRYSVAGWSADKADMNTMWDAQQMDQRGENMEDIWRVTGWWKGKDGKWRFEIDDSQMTFHPERMKGKKQMELQDVLDHDLLFQNYPMLRHVLIDMNMPAGKAANGQHRKGEISLKAGLSSEDTSKALIHEIQHEIQDIEDFAKGANAEVAYRDLFVDTVADIWKNDPATARSISSLKTYAGRINRVEREMAKSAARKSDPSLPFEYRMFDAMFDRYQSAIGEQEARSTEDRLNMDAAQRAAEAPYFAQEGLLADANTNLQTRLKFFRLHKALGAPVTKDGKVKVDKIARRGYDLVRNSWGWGDGQLSLDQDFDRREQGALGYRNGDAFDIRGAEEYASRDTSGPDEVPLVTDAQRLSGLIQEALQSNTDTEAPAEAGASSMPTTRYSLAPVEAVEPKTDEWERGATFDEVKAAHPTLFELAADEADKRNPTQIRGTVSSYRKIYDALKKEGFNGDILDASSGLGYGTRAGRDEYGFNVDDIEPFPDASYKPKYTDYSKLDKQYDAIISNAVLNVIPQDLRDAMVVKIGEMLKPGGRAFINVRGDDVKNASSKTPIDENRMEYFIENTGSYQKGFTPAELRAYLQDALGDGFTVRPAKNFGKVSAVVTKNGTPERYSVASEPTYNRTALLNESTVDKYLRDFAAEKTPSYTKAYIAWMTPKEFLDLTTSKEGRARIEQMTKPLDLARLSEVTRQQPFQLQINHETGEVLGHEGRHRASALSKAGIENIPVILKDESNKYDKAPIGELVLKGQKDNGVNSISSVTAHDLIPLSYENRDEIVKKFGTQPTLERMNERYNGAQTVRYSVAPPVDSENFKNWFKQSKVVNEDGTPKVMYHGTSSSGFRMFDIYGRSKFGLFGLGAYFTDNPEVASSYSQKGHGQTPGVYPVYLSVQNPIDMDAPADYTEWAKTMDDMGLDSGLLFTTPMTNAEAWDGLLEAISEQELPKWEGQEMAQDVLRTMGYDGITHVGGRRAGKSSGVEHQVYIVFDPEQVKSVYNSGEFSPNNPDLRYSVSPELRAWFDQQKPGEDGLGAADAGSVNTSYDRLQAQSRNFHPSGPSPVRHTDVPTTDFAGRNVPKSASTIYGAQGTTDSAALQLEKMIANGELSFDTETDKNAVNKAKRTMNGKGFDGAMEEYRQNCQNGIASKENTALGQQLLLRAMKEGNDAATAELLTLYTRNSTTVAQALQAQSMFRKLSPEGQLVGLRKAVNDLNEKYGTDIELTEEEIHDFTNARSQEEREAVHSRIVDRIANLLPKNFKAKFDTIRYLAMLGNPRTHIRNILGNALFQVPVIAKNRVGAIGEALASAVSGGKIERTKSLTGIKSAELLAEAKSDFEKVKDHLGNISKYNEGKSVKSEIEQQAPAFANKGLGRAINWASEKNGSLLEAEDMAFKKFIYVQSLAGYLQANGISSIAEAERSIEGRKLLARARNYAAQEAMRNTFNDRNMFSDAVASLGKLTRSDNKVARAAGYVTEGIVPFKRTPTNILVRAGEYSPIGAANGIVELINGAKAGDSAKVTQGIDRLAAGLTGSALMYLGWMLAGAGKLRAGEDDDDKQKNFDSLRGRQNYSIETADGKSVTLDWLAPEAIPFFMGAELYNAALEGGLSADDVTKVFKNTTAPMLEMSMLQSLNDMFENAAYAKNNNGSVLGSVLSSALTSYVTQVVPTIFGQAERTAETERMTTYTDKNSALPTDLQYTFGKISQKFPKWDYNQIPYIDAWGRTKETGTAAERAFNNFVNPAYLSNVSTDAMEDELQRLYDTTGENVLPQRADRKIKVNGEDVNLTAQEYVEYATLRGTLSYDLVNSLVSDPGYASLTDEEKAHAISDLYSYANDKAKAELFGAENKNTAKFDEAVSLGISPEDYALSQAVVASLEPEDGHKSVTNMQKYRAIDSTGMSQPEKAAAIGLVMGNEMLTPGGKPSQYAKMQELLSTGMTVSHYLDVKEMYDTIDDEGGTAAQKATKFAKALNETPWLSDTQREMANDFFTYYQTGSVAEANAKAMEAEKYGISIDDFYRIKKEVDANGNNSMSKAELTAYLNANFPASQRRALFELFGGSKWKNPY